MSVERDLHGVPKPIGPYGQPECDLCGELECDLCDGHGKLEQSNGRVVRCRACAGRGFIDGATHEEMMDAARNLLGDDL